ncbi:MAG TPA: SMC family ATPase [Thermomicrobiaceae bacterium]|nr:SMC family ATPase [Thermomicrobiaceae bacterium]
MIPTSLSVRNFMCYRSSVEIDLRGVRVACLSGDNGAGKSALLDCITWALWGKARVNNDRQLMALNASEMEVVFSFLLAGQEFRVSRRRGRGGNGPLTLELQIRDEGRWRSISGATSRETQQAIDRLLCMDYDTFINSSFILQGRADEFTTKTPASRKQVLADILNLSEYDRLEEMARAEFRERDRQLREIDLELARLERELESAPQHQAEVARLSHVILELGRQIDSHDARLQTVRRLLQALEVTAEQRERLLGEIRSLDQELDELVRLRGETERRIESQRAILARRQEIEDGYQRLAALRLRNEELTAQLAARQGLLEQRRAAERVITGKEHEVESELRSLEDRRAALATLIAGRQTLTMQLDQVRKQTAALPILKREIDDTRAEQSALETRRGELQAENRQLKAEMTALKQRMEQIGDEDAACPVCRRPLGEHERHDIRTDYVAEGTLLGDRYRANQARLKEIEAELTEQADDLAALERQRTKLDSLCRSEATLQERLARGDEAAAEEATLAARAETLRQRLICGAIAAEERAELARLERELSGLAYDHDAHLALQQKIKALHGVEADVRQLLVASTALAKDEEQVAWIATQAARCRDERAGRVKQEAELAAQVAQIDEHRALHDELEALLDRMVRERSLAQEAFGAAQERLAACRKLEEERDQRLTERGRTADEKALYDELTLAFGKRGIQAMVIENIVPELQDEANAILDKMPGNSMRIEFQTQRQALTGDNTIETLDIIIGDEAGRRPYELYSGGEAFRVNFAIRVALSTLLARRAGARLQTLVIDEGFGTQDSRGRDGLIEAIHAIEQDFAMILVITHIAELKDLFPTRIDVVKTGDGSLVSVN